MDDGFTLGTNSIMGNTRRYFNVFISLFEFVQKESEHVYFISYYKIKNILLFARIMQNDGPKATVVHMRFLVTLASTKSVLYLPCSQVYDENERRI